MKTILSILFLIGSVTGFSQLRDPLVYYKFDETNILADASGNGYHAKAYGNVGSDLLTNVTGGCSLSLDGTNDYVRIPIVDYGSEFFLSFWARSTSVISSIRHMFSIADASDFFRIYVSSASRVVTADDVPVYAQYLTFVPQEWHNYIFYYKKADSKCVMWIDGVIPATFTDSVFTSTFNSNDSAFIGCAYNRGNKWYGNIDEMLVYKGFRPNQAQRDSIINFDYNDPVGGPVYNPITGQHVRFFANGIENKDKGRNGTFQYWLAKNPLVVLPNSIGINSSIRVGDYDGVCPSGITRWVDTDCGYKSFNYGILRKLKDSSDYDLANRVYIDPTASAGGDGTLATPYDSWSDITLVSDHAYFFKRGTTASISSPITVNRDNVLFGSYGTGDKAIITTASKIDVFYIVGVSRVTVRDLDLRDPYYFSIDGNAACFELSGAIDMDVYNNNMQYHQFGYRTGLNSTGLRSIKNTIHNIMWDGAYVQATTHTEWAYDSIYNINEAYSLNPDYVTGLSNGDGIQLSAGHDEVWVHHEYIDRSGEGNKACIMIPTTKVGMRSIIEFCEFRVPQYYNTGVQAINYENENGTHTIINNIFTGAYGVKANTTGVYNLAVGDTLSGNLFEELGTAVPSVSAGVIMDNNTFYNNTTGITGTGAIGQFRNNIMYLNTTNFSVVTYPNASNNLINTDPVFVNPTLHDFRLQVTSPAKDAGTAISYRLYDINGVAIPKNGITDIGAFEYIP